MYITVEQVRAAGLSSTTADDATVVAAIELWQEVIDRFCRQWFEPRIGDFYIDGTDSDTIFLSVPIISVAELYLNGSPTPLEQSYYRVYNGRGGPSDDRRNPRIALSGGYGHRDIYNAPVGGSTRFSKGRGNQRIIGIFGFTEADGSAPLAIQRALTKLVIQKVTAPIYVDPNSATPGIAIAPAPLTNSGIVIEEWTDWHRLKYANVGDTLPVRSDNMGDVIGDAEVRGLLKLYRAPIAIAAPSQRSWQR